MEGKDRINRRKSRSHSAAEPLTREEAVRKLLRSPKKAVNPKDHLGPENSANLTDSQREETPDEKGAALGVVKKGVNPKDLGPENPTKMKGNTAADTASSSTIEMMIAHIINKQVDLIKSEENSDRTEALERIKWSSGSLVDNESKESKTDYQSQWHFLITNKDVIVHIFGPCLAPEDNDFRRLLLDMVEGSTIESICNLLARILFVFEVRVDNFDSLKSQMRHEIHIKYLISSLSYAPSIRRNTLAIFEEIRTAIAKHNHPIFQAQVTAEDLKSKLEKLKAMKPEILRFLTS